LSIGVITPVIWAVGGWWTIRSYRRYGHLGRRVWVDQARCVIGHRARQDERSKEWPLADVRVVRVTTMRNFAGRIIGEMARIRLRGRITPLVVSCRRRDETAFREFVDFLTSLVPAARISFPISRPALRAREGDEFVAPLDRSGGLQ
jgi:hypothetical protein